MKQGLAIMGGIIVGFLIAQQTEFPRATAQTSDGANYQMFVTSGSTGGPFGFLLNSRTGALKFCNAQFDAQGGNRSSCIPVANSN
jgi:hypothetical protein